MMNLVFALLDLFEGYKLKAYYDTGGVLTIGFGHTGPELSVDTTITQDEALVLLQKDCSQLFNLMLEHPEFSDTKKAALISFGYNCGILRLQDVIKGKDTIDNPKHTTDRHGNVLSWLVKRRRLENLLTQL